MTVHSAFVYARDQWHDSYLKSLAIYKSRYQPSAPEVMFQLSDNGQPKVFRLYRADMASGATDSPNFQDVNLPPIPDTGAQHLVLSTGLSVQLHPIHWNGVEFLVDKLPSDAAELEEWCSKWLDLEELGPPNEHGLLGAVHSVTAPESQDGGLCFSVDFGSAPVQAVDELLAVLQRSGASVVRVSSPWGYEA